MKGLVDVLAPYKLLFEIVAIGALAVAALLGAHSFLEHEREIGRNEVRVEYQQKLQEAKDLARQREGELTAQRDKAIENGNTRDQTIRTLAASAAASSGSLLDTLSTIRDGVPSATVETLRQSTATLTTVLADCQGRYRSVAEAADRHASDVRTFDEAWPRNAAGVKWGRDGTGAEATR